ncbi:MAG: hypothetical protein ACFFE6_02580 [Candidatus Thorarchaeota archaeon]
MEVPGWLVAILVILIIFFLLEALDIIDFIVICSDWPCTFTNSDSLVQ